MNRPATTRVTLALFALVVLSWTYFGVRVGWKAVARDPWDTPAGWVAAHLALEHRQDLLYIEDVSVREQYLRLGAQPDVYGANSPLTLLVYLTDRAGRWVCQVGRHGRPVAEVARELGCDWHTAPTSPRSSTRSIS